MQKFLIEAHEQQSKIMAFYGKQPSYYSSPSMEENTDGQWMEVEDVSKI